MGNVHAIENNTTEDTTMEQTTSVQEQTSQNETTLSEFKLELERKHEKRRQIIAEKRREIEEMRTQLEKYKIENEVLKKQLESSADANLREENEELKLDIEKLKIQLRDGEDVAAKNKELRICVAEMQTELQAVNSNLVNIEQERLEYSKHISALKDVIKVTKDMLEIRETQIRDLKNKVSTVEELLASKEMKIMSDGLREEYEKQLRNIRNLRLLYEERQRIDKKDKENLQEQLDATKKLVEDEQKKNSELQERITELETDNSAKYDTINSLESSLGLSKAECKELQAEIDIINQLFSEVLLGFNSTQDIDLDKLIKIFQENHDLLTDIVTNEESNTTAAALPKMLLDLINQTNKKEEEEVKTEKTEEPTETQTNSKLNSAEEIVENLPKVWKVLIELLSHQSPPNNELFHESDPCYTSVETPTGTKLKLSVSQTFIRLKDLILEKKFLEREMYRLKHLNTHLECRLQDQEKRLELVSTELSKTWHTVGKMQRQHQQLHTHEKILRYELQQKRKMLVEIKEELEYCREKWVLAREKNDSTQKQWKELRKEFAARKIPASDDFNHSGESGYSDDKDTSEDEKGYESDESEGKGDLQNAKDECHSCINKTEFVQNSEERHLSATISEEIENASSESLGKDQKLENLEQSASSDINQIESQKCCFESIWTEDLTAHQSTSKQESVKSSEDELNSTAESSNSKITKNEEISSETSYKQNRASSSFSLAAETTNNYSQKASVKPVPTPEELLRRTQQDINATIDFLYKSTGAIPKVLLKSKPVENETNESEKIAEFNESNENIPLEDSVQEYNFSDLPKSTQDMFKRRDLKLKELEEQCQAIVTRVTNAAAKRNSISTTLDNLHGIYGSTENENEIKELNQEHVEQDVDLEEDNAIALPITENNIEGSNLENKNEKELEVVEENHHFKTSNELAPSDEIDTNTQTQKSTGARPKNTTQITLKNESSKIEEKEEEKSKESSLTLLPPTDAISKTSTPISMKISATTQEILSRREERLRRLEQECSQLVNKVTNTSQRSIDISNKLDNLHDAYSEPTNKTESTNSSNCSETNEDNTNDANDKETP